MGIVHPFAGLYKILGAMASTQLLQDPIVETLPSKTDPIHPKGQNFLQLMLIKTGGIHLQRDFRTVLQAVAQPKLTQ
jgi:hypothetical protein